MRLSKKKKKNNPPPLGMGHMVQMGYLIGFERPKKSPDLVGA
jgi:hypothetical protein